MANKEEKKEMMNRILDRNLREFYPPPCNYLLVQATELLKMCDKQYNGDMNMFEENFIKPTATILAILHKHNMPITFKDMVNQQTHVLVHLTEPEFKLTAGQVVIWTGMTSPGTLSMRYARYVTEREDVSLPDPHYEATKMRVPDKDVPRCLSRAYFSELRTSFKDKGAERYSILMRLFVAYNTTTRLMKSWDYDQVLMRRKHPKLRLRSESGVQESGEDPVAKSTEAQELRHALEPYHTHRKSQQSAGGQYEHCSSSPTGTEASDFRASGEDGHDAIGSSNESQDEETIFLDGIEGNGRDVGEVEPEVGLKLDSSKIRDGYIDPGKAVGPNTSGGKEVKPEGAVIPARDDYV